MTHVHSFQVGALRCHAIQAGIQRLDGGAMFGVVPKPLWEKRIPADPRNRIRLGMRNLLIESDAGLILVDTGVGNKEDPKFHDIYGIDNAGADGRTWNSNSSQTWVFSASTNTGGAGAPPFAGRGDYLKREETGSILRGRARWTASILASRRARRWGWWANPAAASRRPGGCCCGSSNPRRARSASAARCEAVTSSTPFVASR